MNLFFSEILQEHLGSCPTKLCFCDPQVSIGIESALMKNGYFDYLQASSIA